jgi:hypothetical protein
VVEEVLAREEVEGVHGARRGLGVHGDLDVAAGGPQRHDVAGRGVDRHLRLRVPLVAGRLSLRRLLAGVLWRRARLAARPVGGLAGRLGALLPGGLVGRVVVPAQQHAQAEAAGRYQHDERDGDDHVAAPGPAHPILPALLLPFELRPGELPAPLLLAAHLVTPPDFRF